MAGTDDVVKDLKARIDRFIAEGGKGPHPEME